MKTFLVSCLLLSVAVLGPKCHAQTAPHTPAVGSKERSEIMDALRKPIQEHLKKPVLFKAPIMNALGDWVYIQGTALKPDGSPMDYTGTPYEEWIKEGVFDDWFCALLKKDDKGQWKVIQWQIGASDAAYVGWDEQFKAPKAILPQ